MSWKPIVLRWNRRNPDLSRPKRLKVRPQVDRLETRWLLSTLVSGIVEYQTNSASSLPTSDVAGSDGNLWVTEYSAKELAAFSSSGALQSTITLAGAPYAITSAPNGSLWFTENGTTPYIGTVAPNGSGLAQYALPAGANPQGIAVGPDRNIWFVEYGASKVGEITPGGSITTYSLSAGSAPEDIVAGSDGNLWVTEAVGNRIARVSTGGAITEFTVPTKLGTPWGITSGPDGNLWFTEVGASKIGRITTSGLFTEYSLGSGVRPTDIVAGPDGNLWFTESTANVLGRITTGGAVTQDTLPTASSTPDGIAVGPGNSSIWLTESHAGQLAELAWLPTGIVITPDPVDSQYTPFASGMIGLQNGDQRTSIPLNPGVPCSSCSGAAGGGQDSSAALQSSLSLTYNSDTVDVEPIVETTYSTSPTSPVPTQIQVQLTWNNGTPQPWVTFATTGHSPGDTYLLNVQVANPVTTTGVYSWRVEIQATLPNGNIVDSTISGRSGVVANGPSDPLGQGWSVGGSAQLVSDGQGGYLWVDGDGGSREFQAGSGNTFLSPPNDLGTLVKNSNGTFTYTKPNQVQWDFNSQGLLTSVVQPDGPSETFTYNSSGELTAVTMPGGSAATFTYNSNNHLATIVETGDRVLTFTYNSSGDMTNVTTPDGSLRTFTYDSIGHLTNDSLGSRSTTYTYDSAGALSGANEGLGSTLGLVPMSVQGLQTSPALSASQGVAVETDALGYLTTYTLDSLGQPTEIQTPNGGVQTYRYDFAGQPTVSTDPLGRVTTYTYQYGAGDGELTQVTNPDGTTVHYQYDPTFHQVTQQTDELGRVTTYTYNSQGDLISTTDPLGGVTTEVWSNGLLQSTTDPLGHTTTYQYDSQRQEIDEIDPLGNRTTYSYDQAGNQITVEDPLGRVTTYVYDGMRRVVEQIDPLGGITTTTYDPQGDVTSITDPLGHVTQYVYDQRGLEVEEIDAAGTPVQAITTYTYDALERRIGQTDPNGYTTTSAYDAVGNLISTTDALGGVTTYTYDLDNERISTTDPLGRVTTYSYDLMGGQTGETDAVGTPAQRTTTTVYDAVGNTTETIDPLGRVTTYSYDALDRETGETDALGTAVQRTTTTVYDAVGNVTESIDALGQVTTYTYDALDRQISVTDPLGLTTTTAYDAVGDVIATTDPRGFTTTYVYDALNRQIETIDPLNEITTTIYDAVGNVTEAIDPLGHATTYTYDALDRRISATDPLGRTTTTTYDADGNVITTIDPLGFTTTYSYDALNRQTGVEQPDGGITTTTYDADGNVLTTTDPLGHTTSYSYDSLNREVEMINPLGAVTTYIYDAVGNETGLIDPDGNQTTFIYDALDRKIETIDPLKHTTTYTYDALDRLTSMTDALGRVTTYAYDADSRQVGETWYNAGGSAINNIETYTYDADGNQLTAQDISGTYTMTYDALNRIISSEDPFSLTLTYTYDADGNRVQTQDSLGGVTTYVYDADNELTSEQFGGTGQTPLRIDLTYTARGQIATETRYSDLAGSDKVGESHYSYDGDGQITNLDQVDGSGNVLANFTYTYDLADRLLTEDLLGMFTTYSYDADNQLINDGTSGYNYDANGNRDGGDIVIGPGNQLLSDSDWTYTYDADGNLVEKVGVSSGPDHGITWSYTYNNENQMTTAVEIKGSTTLASVTYVYDALGDRIEEDVTGSSVPTQVTKFAYDGQNVWADLDGSDNLVMRRLFLNTVDSVTARISAGGTVAWYLTDRLGSVRTIADATGAVIDRINYDGFGNIISETNPSASDRYLWTGREFDRVTGLQYNRARYYDPATGRWTTEDPIGFAGGDSNLYRYVENDPTNQTDPSGLVPLPEMPMRPIEERLNADVDALFKRLNDDKFAVREQAQEGLVGLLLKKPPRQADVVLNRIIADYKKLGDKDAEAITRVQRLFSDLGNEQIEAKVAGLVLAIARAKTDQAYCDAVKALKESLINGGLLNALLASKALMSDQAIMALRGITPKGATTNVGDTIDGLIKDAQQQYPELTQEPLK